MASPETLLGDPPVRVDSELPDCLQRNRLDTPYFPATSRAACALTVLLCGVFLWTSLHRLHHTDLWGHLSFGRLIAESRELPAQDPFSAAVEGEPLMHSAWLAQVAGYAIYRVGGLEGLVWAHALLVTAMVAASVMALVARGAGLGWSVFGGLLVGVLALPISGVIRPQLFGMVAMPLVLVAIGCLPRSRHPLYWLPLVFVCWANTHGSFVMGLLVLGLFAMGVTWQWWSSVSSAPGDPPCRLARAWLAVAVSLAAICVNPQGWGLLMSVLRFGDQAVLAEISEWQPLILRSFSGSLFFGSLLVTAALLRWSPRRIMAWELLVGVAFAALALTALRMLAWWAIVWPWLAIPHLAATWERYGRRRNADATAGDAKMRTAIAMACIFMTLVVAPPTRAWLHGQSRGEGAILSRETPLYVAAELERRGLSGRVFAPLDWADYLIWRSHGQLRPLVYSHVHLARPETWRDYRLLETGDRDWLAAAQRQQLRYLVVRFPGPSPLGQAVLDACRRKPAHVRVVYQDQVSLVAELAP